MITPKVMDISFTKKTVDPRTGITYYSCNRNIQFMLVGHVGVGKTSLMASMLHQINAMGLSGYFSPIGDTGQALTDLCHQMTACLQKTGDFTGVNGIIKTADIFFFEFELSEASRNPQDKKRFLFPVKIADLPGSWYSDSKITSDKEKEDVKNMLTDSQVSLICVDAPSLMEGDNKQFADFNAPVKISSWYQNNSILHQLKERGHKVIFIISRCEKYRNKREEMKEKLRNCEAYKGLISAMLKIGIPVELTYVHTLGGVSFDRFTKDEYGYWTEEFKIDGSYKPENCHTPLLRALQHACNSVLKKLKKRNAKAGVKITNMLGMTQLDNAQEAMETICDKLRNDAEEDNLQYWELES